MKTDTKFRDNSNRDIVINIMSEQGDILTLSNGMRIKRDLFINKFTPIYENVGKETIIDYDNSSVNPNDFFSQKTEILTESKKNSIQEDILRRQAEIKRLTEEVSTMSNDVIDPIDFLHKPSIDPTIINTIKNVDTNKIKEVPDSLGMMIKVHESVFKGHGDENKTYVEEKPITPINEDTQIAKAKRLSDAELAKYKQIDEDDSIATEQFLNGEIPPSKTNRTLNEEEQLEQDRLLLGSKSIIQSISESNENVLENTPEVPLENFNTRVENIKKEEHKPVEEPVDFINQMFKTFKKNYNIKILLELNEHISEPEFIKLMSNNFNADIVGLYAKDILNKLLSNISYLEKSIYDAIFNEVHKKGKNDGIPEVSADNYAKLIKAGPPKSGKQYYYFINEKNETIKALLTTANKKGYKPAIKEPK